MKVSDCVKCSEFPCADVRHEGCLIPDIEVKPEKIRIVLISEAAPVDQGVFVDIGAGTIFVPGGTGVSVDGRCSNQGHKLHREEKRSGANHSCRFNLQDSRRRLF